MTTYTEETYAADAEKIRELMNKIEPHFPGYSRMVIAFACARTIAAMFGPAKDETRERWLSDYPGYTRAMWRDMDAAIPREPPTPTSSH